MGQGRRKDGWRIRKGQASGAGSRASRANRVCKNAGQADVGENWVQKSLAPRPHADARNQWVGVIAANSVQRAMRDPGENSSVPPNPHNPGSSACARCWWSRLGPRVRVHLHPVTPATHQAGRPRPPPHRHTILHRDAPPPHLSLCSKVITPIPDALSNSPESRWILCSSVVQQLGRLGRIIVKLEIYFFTQVYVHNNFSKWKIGRFLHSTVGYMQ